MIVFTNPKVAFLVALSAILLSITFTAWFSFPPQLFDNRDHFKRNKSAFLELVSFIDSNEGIERISLDGDGVVRVSVNDGGEMLDVTEGTMENLVILFRRAVVSPIERNGNLTIFYAGSESRLGRNYQVQAIHAENDFMNLEVANLQGCTKLFGLLEPSGACIDMVNNSWALFYSWAPR